MRSASKGFFFVVFVFCAVLFVQSSASAGLALQSQEEPAIVSPLLASDVVRIQPDTSYNKTASFNHLPGFSGNSSLDFQGSRMYATIFPFNSLLEYNLLETNIPAVSYFSDSFSAPMLSLGW